jgi:DeoR family transcriptional regulator of aga operon
VNKHERWNALVALLAESGRIGIDDAAARLGVSGATIRRDLDELTEQRVLTRTRGGAVAYNLPYDLPLRYKTARHAPEKQRISAAAAGLVEPGATVGLNGGTTTTEVARALAARIHPDGRSGPVEFMIVTNALNIANELALRPNVKTVTTGGVLRTASYELVGPFAMAMLAEVSLDVVFLGVDAIDLDGGAVAANHEDEAVVNRLMADRATCVVVVADASKLGRRAFARIRPLDRVDALVTDAGADEAATARLRSAGVRVIRV